MTHIGVPVQDRRVQRSQHFNTALRYQLESTRKRGRMAAVALTDGTGMLLAWAGEDAICHELGAVAPMIAHGWPPDAEAAPLPKDDLSVRAIECFGEQLYLASLGGGVAREALLAHSARGVHRILTAN